MHKLFTTESAKVYSQWQGNKQEPTQQSQRISNAGKVYGKKQASDSIDAQRLIDLSADHTNFLEQSSVKVWRIA